MNSAGHLLTVTLTCVFSSCATAPTTASAPKPTAPTRPAEIAASTTALAAVLAAAVQAADPATRTSFQRLDIVGLGDASMRALFPVRAELDAAVERWPEDRRRAALSWLRANATWSTMMHAFVLESFAAAPAFAPRDFGPSMRRMRSATFERRAELAELLRDAMTDPAVQAVASRLSVAWPGFDAASVQARRRELFAYLRMRDDLPRFDAFFAPLMTPGTGVNVEREDGSVLFVVGPMAEAGMAELVLVHEMAHQPVFRTLRRPAVIQALERSQCAFEPITRRYGYETWPSFFAEALVRALSYRLRDVPEHDTGFVFELRFARALRAYEGSAQMQFEEAVRRMLEELSATCAAVRASN